MNEDNVFDLAKFARKPDPYKFDTTIDRSGRPAPKGVRVELDSGLNLKCDVRYDGHDQDGTRRFVVIAEFDWVNHFPTIMWVDEMPRDVTLILRIPGASDEDADRMAALLYLRPHKIIEVS